MSTEDTRILLPFEQQTGLTYEEHCMIINGTWPLNNKGQRKGIRILSWERTGQNELQCNFERVEDES